MRAIVPRIETNKTLPITPPIISIIALSTDSSKSVKVTLVVSCGMGMLVSSPGYCMSCDFVVGAADFDVVISPN